MTSHSSIGGIPVQASLRRIQALTFAVACCIAWVHSAAAQGFSTAFLDRALAFNAPAVSRSALDVRNASTPLFKLAYNTGGATAVRYATRTGTSGAWSIDSSLTWPAADVGLAVNFNSPYTPHIAVALHTYSGYPDPWVGYASRSGSTWTYESILGRTSSPAADSVEGVVTVAITVSGTGVPSAAYCFRRQYSSSNELWVATRVGANNWSRVKVWEGDNELSDVGIKYDGVNFHVVGVDLVSGTALYFKGKTTWSAAETIASPYCSTIALGIDGLTPHVAYVKSGILYWAYRDASLGWQATELRPAPGSEGPRLISMAGTGSAPVIAYHGGAALDSVRVASKYAGGWSFRRAAELGLVSSPLSVGYYTASGTVRAQITRATFDGDSNPIYVMDSGTLFMPNDTRAQEAGDEDQPWVSDGSLATLEFAASPVVGAGARVVHASLVVREPGDLVVDLLDVTGRRVAGLRPGRLGTGTHSLDLTPRGDLAAGLYFLQARLDNGAVARAKLTVLR